MRLLQAAQCISEIRTFQLGQEVVLVQEERGMLEQWHETGVRMRFKVMQWRAEGCNGEVWVVQLQRVEQEVPSTAPDAEGGEVSAGLKEGGMYALKVARLYSNLPAWMAADTDSVTHLYQVTGSYRLEHVVMESCRGCGMVVQGYAYGLVTVGTVQTPALLMELADGDVQRVIEPQPEVAAPMDAMEAWRAVVQMTYGLDQLHEKAKAIHRDLKPSNVMMFRDPKSGKTAYKLADFGTAFILEHVGSLVPKGCVEGTRGFMAPEQLEGRVQGIQLDTFQLAELLMSLRTGKLPFFHLPIATPATAAAVAKRRTYEEVVSCGHYSHLEPTEMEFLQRCLAYDWLERPLASELWQSDPYIRYGPAALQAKIIKDLAKFQSLLGIRPPV